MTNETTISPELRRWTAYSGITGVRPYVHDGVNEICAPATYEVAARIAEEHNRSLSARQ